MPDINRKPCAVVAEDEFLVHTLAAETLADAGFTVLEAGHAVAALVHLETQAETVNVLFTDIQMPGEMDGPELAHHAFRHGPWIALMITSGNAKATLWSCQLATAFFARPYRLDHIDLPIQTLPAPD